MLKRNGFPPSLSSFFCILGVVTVSSALQLVSANSTDIISGKCCSNITLLNSTFDTIQNHVPVANSPSTESNLCINVTAIDSTSYGQTIHHGSSGTSQTAQSVSIPIEDVSSDSSSESSLQVMTASLDDIHDRKSENVSYSGDDGVGTASSFTESYSLKNFSVSHSTVTMGGTYTEESSSENTSMNTSVEQFIQGSIPYTYEDNTRIVLNGSSETLENYEERRFEEISPKSSKMNNLFPHLGGISETSTTEAMKFSPLNESSTDYISKELSSVEVQVVKDTKVSNLSLVSLFSRPSTVSNLNSFEIVLLNNSSDGRGTERYSDISPSEQSYQQNYYQLEKPFQTESRIVEDITSANITNGVKPPHTSPTFINYLLPLENNLNKSVKTQEISNISQIEQPLLSDRSNNTRITNQSVEINGANWSIIAPLNNSLFFNLTVAGSPRNVSAEQVSLLENYKTIDVLKQDEEDRRKSKSGHFPTSVRGSLQSPFVSSQSAVHNHSLTAEEISPNNVSSDGMGADKSFTTSSSNHRLVTVNQPDNRVNQSEKFKNCSVFEIFYSDNHTFTSSYQIALYPASENTSQVKWKENPACFTNLSNGDNYYGYLSNSPIEVVPNKTTSAGSNLLNSPESKNTKLPSLFNVIVSGTSPSSVELTSQDYIVPSINESTQVLPTPSETILNVTTLLDLAENKTVEDSALLTSTQENQKSIPVTYVLNETKSPDAFKLGGLHTVRNETFLHDKTIKFLSVFAKSPQGQTDFTQITKTFNDSFNDNTSHEKYGNRTPSESYQLTAMDATEQIPNPDSSSEIHPFSYKYLPETSTSSTAPSSVKVEKDKISTSVQVPEIEKKTSRFKNDFQSTPIGLPSEKFERVKDDLQTTPSTFNRNDMQTKSSLITPSSESVTYFAHPTKRFNDIPRTAFGNILSNLSKSGRRFKEMLRPWDIKSTRSSWSQKNHYVTSSTTSSAENAASVFLHSAERFNTSEAKPYLNSVLILQPSETKSTPIGKDTTEGRIFWNLCFTKKPIFNSNTKSDSFKKSLPNEIPINKGSSNTKVLWNLCPTKKPDSTTENMELTEPTPSTSPSMTTLTSVSTSSTSAADFTPASNGSPTLPTVSNEEITTETLEMTSSETNQAETTQSIEQQKEDLFPIYWNVPTFQCHKYGFNFSQVKDWGLRQNYQDEFRGEEIAILYDPGEFPALLPATTGRRIPRNGGVPQEGSLSRHLSLFESHLDKLIPDLNFSGLAIIDFEHWRPVWRQNWGSLSPYRDFSRLIERRRHPFWFPTMVEVEAMYRYELGARVFLLDTLRAGRRLRPRASWGYYGYPFCFNYTPHNNKASCSYEVQLDNDSLFWLFSEITAYYPSLYLKYADMHPAKRERFIKGRLDESMRVAQDVPVYPYVWYKYHDNNQFLSKEDLANTLIIPLSSGCKGVVMWGASRDVNSREKCAALLSYLNDVIGPVVKDLHSNSFSYGNETDANSEEEKTEEEGEYDQDKKANYDIRDFEV